MAKSYGWFWANVNSRSRSLYVIDGPSVCLSSVCRWSTVCRLKRSCALLRLLKFSAIFLRHVVTWPSMMHMSFRLVLNSVTLDDLERRNSPIRSVISPNSVAFGTDCVKVVEDTPILSAAEMWATESSFNDISFMAILAGVTSSESDKMRHSALANENLTNNQP